MTRHDPWELSALEACRMLKLAVVIGRHPGIEREALYREFQAAFPSERAGASTLNAALRRLKDIQLLDQRPHRQGYFLTDHTFDPDEQEALLVALRIHGEDLGNPHAAEHLKKLLDRLRHPLDEREVLAYPVEAIGQRRITDTRAEGLATYLKALREPIRRGELLLLEEAANPYDFAHQPREHRAYPLQLIFHNVSWYLLFEYAQPLERTFHVLRVDRLAPQLKRAVGVPPRGHQQQLKRLRLAHRIMAYGWDAAVPAGIDPGQLDLVRVRFKASVADFLREVRSDFRAMAELDEFERERARIQLKEERGPVVLELLLSNCLPVQHEFIRWLSTWGDAAEALEPRWLREAMAERYRRCSTLYK